MEEHDEHGEHVKCLMFTTEESRVAMRHALSLMTSENIQVVERWLDRLKRAESSAWEVFIRVLKLCGLLLALTILYHLLQADFIAWVRKLHK